MAILESMNNLVNFSCLGVQEFGLIPLNVATWGPFVLLNVGKESSTHQEVDGNMVESEWLGSCSDALKTNGVDSSLSYVCRRVYDIECNWKVRCLNISILLIFGI